MNLFEGVYDLEEWRDVEGWEDRYEVSSLGRVRSKAYIKQCCNAHGPFTYLTKPILLAPFANDGYLQLRFKRGGRGGEKITVKVHRLVAQAFLTNPEDKPEVNHKNSDRSDNRVNNLEWATTQENILHAFREGRKSNAGILHPRAKLTVAEVEDIRAKRLAGSSVKDLALEYNVCLSTIYYVASNKRWRNV